MNPTKAALPLLVIVTTSGCATASSTRHVVQPGYTCAVGQQFEDGATATAALDLEGRQLKAEWQWRLWIGALPLKWSAVNTVDGSTPPSQADGLAMLNWGVPPFTAKSKLRLELTTNPNRRYVWGNGIATDYFRSGDARSLTLPWPDLVALSRGASSLHLALRRPDGTLVYDVGVDPKTFIKAASDIDHVLSELAEAKGDFRNRCQKVDDVDPQIIIT